MPTSCYPVDDLRPFLEERMRMQRLKTGIPITNYDVQQLRKTAEQRGVKSPFV